MDEYLLPFRAKNIAEEFFFRLLGFMLENEQKRPDELIPFIFDVFDARFNPIDREGVNPVS